MRGIPASAAFLIPALAILAGCAVGPDYTRPDPGIEVPASWAAPDSHPGASPLSAALGEQGDGRWWKDFQDSVLDSLVLRALRHNNDLAAAAARVLEARALAAGAAADRWPSLEIGGSASRSKSANLNFPGFISPYLSSFSANATMRYEADLWGRVARDKEAAVASLLAGENDRRALARSIVAEVVRARLEILELEGQLALTRATIENYDLNLQVVQDRYRQGLVPALDVDLATQNLAAARASESPLRQQLGAARRRLEILCGSYPGGREPVPAESSPAAAADNLPAVPGGLPAELLQRRPDLQAAELRLHSAVARIGQAKAALYPRISLTANTGFSSRELADLGKAGTDVWSLVGNLVMPLINRGATQAQIKAAEARAAQAAATYRKTVLEAFAEVENALDRDYYLARQQEALIRSTTAATAASRQAQDRYRRGLDNILVMLESQRRAYSAESQLLTVRRQRQSARVDLILALGGPWNLSDPDNRSGHSPQQQVHQGVSP